MCCLKPIQIICALLLSLSYVSNAYGQIKFYQGKYLKDFLETETHFVYRGDDKKQDQELCDAISRVWTSTPIKFISYSSYVDMLENEVFEGNSFIALETSHSVTTTVTTYVNSTRSSSSSSVERFKVYLNIYQFVDDKKQPIAKILLPGSSTLWSMSRKLNTKDFGEYLMYDADIPSWSPGQLSHQLSLVDHQFRNKFATFLDYPKWGESKSTLKSLMELRNDTLYIPSYLWIHPFPNKKMVERPLNPEKYLKKYNYPIKMVDDDELSDLIMDTTRQVYYLHSAFNYKWNFTIYKSNDPEGIVFYNSELRFGGYLKRTFKVLQKVLESGKLPRRYGLYWGV